MKRYNLKVKNRNYFIYGRHNEQSGHDEIIEIQFKNTWDGSYKGVQIISYQKECNTDGFNNAVGLRKNELLRLPFMIAHFMICRKFIKEGYDEIKI